MTNEYVIDELRWPDITAATAIERDSFPAGAWSAESFWRELVAVPDRAFYLAARDGTELVGYLGVAFDDSDAHLHTVTVATEARGRGIAESLMTRAGTRIREVGCTRWLLEVSEHNHAAIRLYERLGFADVAVRTDYYGTGDSARVMALAVAAWPAHSRP